MEHFHTFTYYSSLSACVCVCEQSDEMKANERTFQFSRRVSVCVCTCLGIIPFVTISFKWVADIYAFFVYNLYFGRRFCCRLFFSVFHTFFYSIFFICLSFARYVQLVFGNAVADINVYMLFSAALIIWML